jgi:hypothetical protein
MRLSDFIAANREPILAEWEALARKAQTASDSMDIASLRAHASEMLTTIAADLKTQQDKHEQFFGDAEFQEVKGTVSTLTPGLGQECFRDESRQSREVCSGDRTATPPLQKKGVLSLQLFRG